MKIEQTLLDGNIAPGRYRFGRRRLPMGTHSITVKLRFEAESPSPRPSRAEIQTHLHDLSGQLWVRSRTNTYGIFAKHNRRYRRPINIGVVQETHPVEQGVTLGSIEPVCTIRGKPFPCEFSVIYWTYNTEVLLFHGEP